MIVTVRSKQANTYKTISAEGELAIKEALKYNLEEYNKINLYSKRYDKYNYFVAVTITDYKQGETMQQYLTTQKKTNSV